MLMQFAQTAEIAERIARHARSLGYTAVIDASRLSASRYVVCRAADGDAVKVRVSDHDPRPSHDDADIDVDTGTGRGLGLCWAQAVSILARAAERPVPATAARVLAKREAGRRAVEDAKVAAAYPAEWAAAEARTGADRREARRLLRRRYEGAFQ